jgi:hypothetical protein
MPASLKNLQFFSLAVIVTDRCRAMLDYVRLNYFEVGKQQYGSIV